jgi:hypothetical protein
VSYGKVASHSVADLFTRHITPEMIDTLVGFDYFTIVIQSDEFSDYEFYEDLTGDINYILDNDMELTLRGIIGPMGGVTWFQELISDAEPIFHQMCCGGLLFQYLNELYAGTIEMGYRNFLRSKVKAKGEGTKKRRAYASELSQYEALKGHSLFSFIVSYLLKDDTLEECDKAILNSLLKVIQTTLVTDGGTDQNSEPFISLL